MGGRGQPISLKMKIQATIQIDLVFCILNICIYALNIHV